MPIEYRVGDAAEPAFGIACAAKPERGITMIVHIVNDRGAWGQGLRARGFTAALERYPRARLTYRAWAGHEYFNDPPFALGWCLPETLATGVSIAHLCAQHGLPGRTNPHPLDYAALDTALARCAEAAARATPVPVRIQMPRIGVGLARGNWKLIEPLIEKHLCAVCPVTVFDPPKPPAPGEALP